MRKIEKKIMFSFSVLSIAFLTMTITTIIQVNEVNSSSRYIQYTLDPSIRANLLLSKAVNDSLSSLQNYFIYKDMKYLRQRDAYWSVIDKQNQQLLNYSKSWRRQDQIERLELFQSLLSEYRKEQNALLNQGWDQTAVLQRLNEINNYTRVTAISYLRLLSDPQIWEMERVFLLEEQQQKLIKSTAIFYLLFGILGCILLVIVLRRAVILPLHKTVKIAEEISTGDYTLNKAFSGEEKLDNALRLMLERLMEKQEENLLQKQMLEVYNDQLKASNDELSQFSYRTSHDLKAPLVTVRRLATLITEDIKDGEYIEAQQNSEKIESHVQKLENLVVDILNLAQAELKGENLESVNFQQILQEVESRLSLVYLDNNIEIEAHCTSKTSLVTSKIRLGQILENLVSNSIKYQDKNKAKPFIKVTFDKEYGSNVITVEDNGLGIPEKYQDRVFEMFQRFHPHIAYGSGLGLYIIKKHVEKLHGQITLFSTEQGTKFIISIPE